MSSKPGIPSWQRAPITRTTQQAESQPETKAAPEEKKPIEASDDTAEEGDGPGEQSVDSHMDQVDSLLQDPSLKNASDEKKREFLVQKSIPVEKIDDVLKAAGPEKSQTTFSPSAFKQQQQQQPLQPAPPRPAPAQSSSSGPPIITYPEYLVEAHKPPPLITPGRVIGASYFVGGLATLIYAGNKFLVQPMVASLTESRHDFATHSQSKLDEFNERLEKIVSKVPEPALDATVDMDGSDDDSLSGDPTELFHRDFGTQTSPGQSQRSSTSSLSVDNTHQGIVARQTADLTAIKERLADLTERMENQQESESGRQESMNQLQHYVDGLLYSSPAINVWTNQEDVLAAKASAAKNDPIEELKKEIRSMKAVFLSPRRFIPGQ